ncbi:MAG TPA: hypothetical protein VIY66_02180 [Candidatus Acidoferrales bacterium]
MQFPETLTEHLPFLLPVEEPWQPISLVVLGLWCSFYALFLLQAARGSGPLLMIDLVFIPVHEGGHLLFRFFGGQFLMVAGAR